MTAFFRFIAAASRYAGQAFRFVRNAVFNILFLLVCFAVVALLFSSQGPTIQPNSILKLSLVGNIVDEQRQATTLTGLAGNTFGAEAQTETMPLQDVLDIIHGAAADTKISAILLDVSRLGAVGMNQMEAIGQALDSFRKTGKRLIAAGDYYTQKQYYLAACADTVTLNPMGAVTIHGFGLYRLYFKEALDKLHVNFHIFRVGAYKSAIEPLIRDSMSPEARTENSQWLEALWRTYIADITRERSLPAGAVSSYVSNIDDNLIKAGGDTARLAVSSGLVDKLLTREQLRKYLRRIAGGKYLRIVSTNDYLKTIQRSYTTRPEKADGIGIIVAEGDIVGGRQPAGVIGSETLVTKLKKARRDNAIKAVVLRVNSGGGSAFASELIRQEILELKKAGKPLVVSMGTMAASGAYWISADADQIWASPTTLTGSIGIFGAIPTFEHTLATLGVHGDGVGTTAISTGLNLSQPLSPALEKSIQITVNHGYKHFLTIVSQGRHISMDKIARIAQGRVYDGQRAMELGLVDHLGTMGNAIDAAAHLAGLRHYRAVYITGKTSLPAQVLRRFTSLTALISNGHSPTSPWRALYDQAHRELADMVLMSDPRGIYAQSLLKLPLD